VVHTCTVIHLSTVRISCTTGRQRASCSEGSEQLPFCSLLQARSLDQSQTATNWSEVVRIGALVIICVASRNFVAIELVLQSNMALPGCSGDQVTHSAARPWTDGLADGVQSYLFPYMLSLLPALVRHREICRVSPSAATSAHSADGNPSPPPHRSTAPSRRVPPPGLPASSRCRGWSWIGRA
jgi:hypothetical protein